MLKHWAAAALCAGLAAASTAQAQQVLLDGVPVAGSPNVVNQVAVPDQETLVVDIGASIIVNADAVVDAANFTTITVLNAGTITSTADVGIDSIPSTLFLTNSGTITGNEEGVRARRPATPAAPGPADARPNHCEPTRSGLPVLSCLKIPRESCRLQESFTTALASHHSISQ